MKCTLKIVYCLAIVACTGVGAVSAQNITTVAGNGTPGNAGDGGAATLAKLNDPTGVFVDAAGNIYIADNLNHNVRKVSTSGTITTIAGTSTAGFSGDGGQATAAQLSGVQRVILDGAGNIYLNDAGNYRVRKINSSGIITTVAGTGSYTYTGDGIPATAAGLSIHGMTFDPAGNLVIADISNNRIRMINSFTGIILTIAGAGTSGYTGDGGQATAATFNSPIDVAYDGAGNLFISDYMNSVIRKVNTSGVISTYAGNGTMSYGGDGGPATAAALQNPVGLGADVSGNLYICDRNNNRLRRVSTSGVMTTAAGTGSATFSGDGGPATAAGVGGIRAIKIDNAGNIFITGATARIRKIGNSTLHTLKPVLATVSIYPNPAKNSVHLKASENVRATICDVYGRTMQDVQDAHDIDISSLMPGMYIIAVYGQNGALVKKETLVKE